MNEKNARQILTLAAISSVTGLVVAIVLALRGQQDAAALFLVLSLADVVAAWFLYRQYTRLRSTRWNNELKSGQDEISKLLSEDDPKEEQEPPVAQP
jgi:uncharacterized membrane protein